MANLKSQDYLNKLDPITATVLPDDPAKLKAEALEAMTHYHFTLTDQLLYEMNNGGVLSLWVGDRLVFIHFEDKA